MASDTPLRSPIKPPITSSPNTNYGFHKLRKRLTLEDKPLHKKPPKPPISPKKNNNDKSELSFPNQETPNISSGISYTNDTEYELVEANFNRVLLHLSNKKNGEDIKKNVITHQYERDNIIKYGNMLYEQDDYNELCLSQIYMVLIYTYYGMHLIEQLWDLLTFEHIRAYFTSDQYKVALKLMYDISSQDILDSLGENIASKIRCSFMGLNKVE